MRFKKGDIFRYCNKEYRILKYRTSKNPFTNEDRVMVDVMELNTCSSRVQYASLRLLENKSEVEKVIVN